jgi:hypothetical protein
MRRILKFQMENALMNDMTNDTMHQADTMRDLTAGEIDSVSGGLYGSAVLYDVGTTIWLYGGCAPTLSYASYCP